jgi:hypothetical protein
MSVYELTAREIYESYARGVDPAGLAGQSRSQLARRLRIEGGLTQEDAYYAADQMLVYSRQRVEAQTIQNE